MGVKNGKINTSSTNKKGKAYKLTTSTIKPKMENSEKAKSRGTFASAQWSLASASTRGISGEDTEVNSVNKMLKMCIKDYL